MTLGLRSQADAEHALRCRMPGCDKRWTVDFGNGRLCSHHDAIASRGGVARPSDNAVRHQAPIPLREAVRPFAEPQEPDEEYVHDDRP